MFEAIGKHSEGESLRLCTCISRGFTVGKYARQFGYFSDPPAVVFLFEFHAKRNHLTIVIQKAVDLPLPYRTLEYWSFMAPRFGAKGPISPKVGIEEVTPPS